MKTPTLGLLLLTPALTVNGAGQHTPQAATREMLRTGSQPERFQIQDTDAQMANAVIAARKSVSTFIAAVQNPMPLQQGFEVKVPFLYEGGREHIWLTSVTFTGGRLHGRVANKPGQIRGLKIGDPVSGTPGEITDWAYVDNGTLVGGYTLRVLFQELSPERKKAFEKNANFQIPRP